MPKSQSVLPGFRARDPKCRLTECADGFCSHNCPTEFVTRYDGRAMSGLGAGDGAHLPSGEPGEAGDPDDFLAGRKPWPARQFPDPHDGDFNDDRLGK
jgi:hypothetical protein